MNNKIARIPLTRFTDFINASNMDRQDVVKDTIDFGEYSPCKDFYKDMRDAIVSFFKDGGTIEDLEEEMVLVRDKKKPQYLLLLHGFKKWVNNKRIIYLGEEACDFELNGLKISINPELLLKINGKKTVVKLYFKGGKQINERKKDSFIPIPVLMKNAFSVFGEKYKDYDFAVLDIRNSRLFHITESTPIDKILLTLKMEAKNWLAYQSELQKG